MATCKEVSRLISEGLDQPLPFRTRLAVRLHLALCRLCSRYQRQLRFLQAALRESPARCGEHSQHALSGEARQRIKGRLDEHG